ncbi:hypothetical protein APHAL10511_004127 [Amanita phalloides]|nr:hypothetical protein APHAL10511_004127 [Amanita phalloides]
MSNSSNSPPLPCTPPPRPSRSSTRYPDLGRVPLHRRGTSQTYERLEDLLREAGYKETRVFTPEGEHEDGTYHEDDLPSARRSKGGVREGVDAVVGFLSGLLPSSTAQSIRSVATTRPGSSERVDDATESPTSQTYTPALSPALSAKTQKQLHASSRSTPRSSTDDISALRRTHSPISATPIPHSPPSPYYSYRHPQHLQHHAVQRISGYSGPSQRGAINAPPSRQPSLRAIKETLPSQQAPQPTMTLAHPRPSRATAYLRRMASRSEIPERPNSTPVRPQPRVYLNDHDIEIGGGKNNDEHETDHQPPLPRSWLETVARAVLFGGVGLHIGGPSSQRDQQTFPSPPSSATISPKQGPRMLTQGKMQTLRHTRSSISQASSQPKPKRARSMKPHALRAALTEQTNKSRSKVSVRSVSSGVSIDMLSPPELFLRVGRGRATHCEGQVSHTRVYCRSAPSSRSASAARGGGKKGILKHGRCGNGSKKAERDRVPSLAKTKAEGDMWARPKKRKAGMDGIADRSLWGRDMAMDGGGGRHSRHRQQASIRLGDRMDGGYGSEAAVGCGYPDDGYSLSSDEEDEISDDDDGELDLARILVPPKRQHSIISLRKHLAVPIRVSSRASSKARAAASASRLGEGVGVGEFEREIEGGGGASAALSKVVGSSTIPAIRIRGGYEPGHGYPPPILGPVGAEH